MKAGNDPAENPTSEHGWRWVSFTIPNLEDTMAVLTTAGAQIVIPPFTVLPGLRESMLSLPSGIIIQPVEKKLSQMVLHLAFEKLRKFVRLLFWHSCRKMNLILITKEVWNAC